MTSTGTYNVEDISKYKKIFLIARSSNDNVSTGSAYPYDYISNISNKLMVSVNDAKYGVISVVSNIQISCTVLTGVYLYLYGAN